MRTIIVGESGQIGGWLSHFSARKGNKVVGTYSTVPYPGLEWLDAADLEGAANWLRRQRPDVVFYPAGFTWVDGCERDPSRSDSANVEQPLNLARVVAEQGGRFVYFSTDYVFDGLAGPFSESASPHPLNAYGRSKLDAERRLADELGDQQLTVRTSWVYGPERQGKNFAYQLVRTLREGRTIDCPSDQISTPSYGPDVARVVLDLVGRRISGLIHVVGPELVDRVEFARSLARRFGLDQSLIISKTTAELSQGAPRPLTGGLLSERLNELGVDPCRGLDQAMDDFMSCLEQGAGWADPR